MIRVLSLATLFPSLERPGFGAFVARQFAELAQRGDIDLTVIAPRARLPWRLSKSEPLATERWEGIAVHRPAFLHLPKIGGPWNAALIARAVLPLARQLHASAPFDVIDAQFFYPDGPAAARIAAALGLPLSIKARGSDIHYWGTRNGPRLQMIAAATQAAGLLAVSEALRRDMIALGIPGDRIAVHYTGLDHAAFAPGRRSAARAALGLAIPDGATLLTSAGNLVPLKGIDRAIAALALLPQAHLAIAGDGPERARLGRAVDQAGLRGRVHMLGRVDQTGMRGLLAAADVFVLPSEREGLANVWIEALASGTPLVIPDVGGAREVVRDPSAGRIVARDPAAIAAGVRAILADPSDPYAVAQNAARFDWAVNAAQLFAHYERLAGAPASRASRS